MVRQLGRRWVPLHRLVYLAAALVVIHFLWLVKSDLREPLVYAAVLTALLGLRVWFWRGGSRTGKRTPNEPKSRVSRI
jgi:sulfoxide reductase heme-binding subunit YedZ